MKAKDKIMQNNFRILDLNGLLYVTSDFVRSLEGILHSKVMRYYCIRHQKFISRSRLYTLTP